MDINDTIYAHAECADEASKPRQSGLADGEKAAGSCLDADAARAEEEGPRLGERVFARLGQVRDAAVAALDFIDRNCDEFLEQQQEEPGGEGALGPVLRRLSVDDDSAPAVDGGGGSGDGAAVEELRHQLEQYRTKAEIETRLLAEQHAKTAAELARKTADYDELRHRLGAVEAERQRKLAASAAPPPPPRADDEDAQDDGFVLVRDSANPTGASPPVPPPEYCVVSVVSSD